MVPGPADDPAVVRIDDDSQMSDQRRAVSDTEKRLVVLTEPDDDVALDVFQIVGTLGTIAIKLT